VTDIVGGLSKQRFDGGRFDFEPYVESAESAQRVDLKFREISDDGMTICGGDRLQSIRKEMFVDESRSESQKNPSSVGKPLNYTSKTGGLTVFPVRPNDFDIGGRKEPLCKF
jgi:hypothetical protein